MSTGEAQPRSGGPTWRALFPLLAGELDASASARVDGASMEEVTTITRLVAEAAVHQHLNTRLDALMPGLTWIDELPWADLGTRPRNALLRRGIDTLTDLIGWSTRDLLDLPGVGGGTAVDMLAVLARCSIGGAQHLVAASAIADAGDGDAVAVIASPAPEVSDEAVDEDALYDLLQEELATIERLAAISRLTDDLMILARWQALRGARTTSLFSSDGLQEAPAHIRQARERVLAMTAADLVGEVSESPAVILEIALTGLTDREITVLRQRTFADEPVTLDALGRQLGLTRERARQIAKQAETSLIDEVMNGALGDLASAVRSRIGLVCRLEYLLDVFPALREPVPSVGRPAWRVLDRIDGTFEIEDGWAAVPQLDQAREITRSVVASCVNTLGVAELHEVAQRLGITGDGRRAELLTWIEASGCVVYGEHVSPRQLSIPDWGALILNTAGTPLSVDEIVDRLPVDRAASSVRNALAIDQRFVRADRDTFALAEWGGRAYAGIRDAIGRAIDVGGGAVDVEALVRDLTTQFTVAASSVRAYALAHPFETAAGKVRRREATPPPAANPSGTRRLYRIDESWALRLQITSDHARGSGSVMPIALAAILGLSPGDSVAIPSLDGTQSVYWTGLQPSLGSIRRLVEARGLQDGDWACAVFEDCGGFSLVPVDSDGRFGVALALALAGTPEVDFEDARVVLARALSLPSTSSWSSIIAAARNRGEDDLAEALLADPAVSVAATEPSGLSTTPETESTVEEILDLL